MARLQSMVTWPGDCRVDTVSESSHADPVALASNPLSRSPSIENPTIKS